MPIPGPRTQFGQLPGYDNPDHLAPNRLNPWLWPGPTQTIGESPGTTIVSRRGIILGLGMIRSLWRPPLKGIDAPGGFNQATSSNDTSYRGAFHPTRHWLYKCGCISRTSGTSNTEFHGLHTPVAPATRKSRPSLGAGQRSNPRTVRNRMTSFGSRVQPINNTAPAAQQ